MQSPTQKKSYQGYEACVQLLNFCLNWFAIKNESAFRPTVPPSKIIFFDAQELVYQSDNSVILIARTEISNRPPELSGLF